MKTNEFMNDSGHIKIKYGVTTIQKGVLPNREFICVHIPISVVKIEPFAINSDVNYNGVFISKEEVLKYGCENIPRIYFFKINNVNITEQEVFLQMPLNIDSIKGYIANYKIYNKLKESLLIDNLNNFYKLCYILGIFNLGGNALELCIQAVLNIYKNDSINETLEEIECKDFDLRFSKFIINNQSKFNILKPYFKELYTNFRQISNIILKRKEQIISDKNTKKLQNQRNGLDVTSDIDEIEYLKKHRKETTVDDVIEYFNNNTFIIRKGNEELEKIIPIIKFHIIKQEDFDIIQDIYEEAILLKKIDKNIFESVMNNDKGIHYGWLENDDTLNLILGYLVNCCAKINHVGQEIMRFSMTNPYVRNLVLLNGDKIIGKATAYYNFKERYLLFNNVELSYQFMFSDKTKLEKRKALEELLKGIKFQVTKMNEKGYLVNQVRIGMARNDLANEIKEQFKIEKTNLLANIKYGTYVGDANEEQAIIERKTI